MAINIDKENLEKALQKTVETEQPPISKEEEIGFHKGALNTLLAERNELIKIIANVEAIMQAHLKRLGELGVTTQKN
ncbi:hypothetical protein J4456_04500 [Candidatus Pacearchaeota archaeon]|nr:hypothetical protein [Candidatus Pacearchaeota archaeon]